MLTAYNAAELLLDIHAVSFRPTYPFRFESGLLSPIYIDCRRLPSYPRERERIIDSLTEAFQLSGAKAEIVVGADAFAIPFADGVARRLELPMAYVRRDHKTHGMRKQIEGASVENRQVLLIADVISTGTDFPARIEAIRASGGTISRCQAVFDMELGDNDRFLVDNEIPFGCLTRLTDLLVVAQIKKHVSSAERTAVEDWQRSPLDWDRRRRQKLEEAAGINQRAVAGALVRTKAVQIRTNPPFDCASGGKGPIYTDNRILLGYPAERELILNAMAEMVVQEVGIRNLDCIGAVATAGIPWASGLSDRLGLPMVVVQSRADLYGLEKKIEGVLEQGMRVLLLEDLVNNGTSIIAAAHALVDAGAVVVTCMSIFNYGLQSTRDTFAEKNLALLSLSDLESLLIVGVENRVITVEQQQLVQNWALNPQGWMKVKESN
jgi:orotate phosphoribosyltransferase